MRIVFAGTPDFAREALAALSTAGFDIALVLTQPDRPAGRGLKLQSSPVKQLAEQLELPVAQPRSLRLDGRFPDDAAAAHAALVAAQAQVMVVAAYGLLLPQWTLEAFALGCVNIHASLLPRWRGAAPIHRAIEAGDAETGISIMQMDAGLDTGAVLAMQALPITATDTTGSLHDKLAALGAQMVVRTLRESGPHRPPAQAQPEMGVTYAEKITKAQAQIDWGRSAAAIARQIRAFNPNPGAQTLWDGQVCKIWAAKEMPQQQPQEPPGSWLGASDEGLLVACGNGVLCLTELQRAGGKRLAAAEWLRGQPMVAGARFMPPDAHG